MVHTDAPNETYVSIWANGSMQGINPSDMQLTTKATVDVVSGDMKIRAKGEVMVVDGMIYLKLSSVDGSMSSDVATVSGKLVQHKWVKMPFDATGIDITQNPAFSLTDADLSNPENTFAMTSAVTSNGGTTYTLSLKPDAAAQLALAIREMLNDTSSVSDDFFPWRDLAEGMHFEMVVKTDSKDVFAGTTYTMSTRGKQSSFELSGSEKPTAALSLKAPTNAVSISELEMMFSSDVPSYLGEPMMDDESMDEESMEPTMDEEPMTWDTGSFDILDDGTLSSCDDPSLDPMKKLMMQRDGSCPVNKATTRQGGW